MKCVILFGPLAVGKMTVGQELERITDLKLFHNHMTIEMVLLFFDMKSQRFRELVNSFRIQMLNEIAKSKIYERPIGCTKSVTSRVRVSQKTSWSKRRWEYFGTAMGPVESKCSADIQTP